MGRKIIIEYVPGENGSFSGWNVTEGDKMADRLGWDEMLGTIAALTMPKESPHLNWMQTQEQRDAWNNHMEGLKRNKSNDED